MEDFELRKLEIGINSTEDEICINVGGHGGDTEFLNKEECQKLIDYLTQATTHIK